MWDKALECGIWKDICTTSARQWVTNMYDKMEACKLHPTHPGACCCCIWMIDWCMHVRIFHRFFLGSYEIHQTLYPFIYYSLWGQTESTFKPKNLQPSKKPQAWKKVQGTSVVLVLILKRIYGPGYFISYKFDYPFGWGIEFFVLIF
jgi:hypothetical protein